MEPLNILIWLGIIIAAVIVLTVIGLFAVAVYAAVVGIRAMREEETITETTVFRGKSR